MFSLSRIADQVRLWRARRQRRALADHIATLPYELQKDIGWPAQDLRGETAGKSVSGPVRS